MSLSPMPSISLLWVTDPWITLTHTQDTTLRLVHEALKLGIPTYWSGSDFIVNSQSTALNVVPVTTDFVSILDPNHVFKTVEMEASKFQQIHYRVDPPVDKNYISTIENILAKGAKKNQILNPVEIITGSSEKIPPVPLLDLAPRLEVIRTRQDFDRAFLAFAQDEIIVTKPLNLAQSIGVKKHSMPKSRESFETLIRSETKDFSHPILVEEFLPEIESGEVRVWYACGQIIAALKKHPKVGDFRVLIDEGSRVEAHHLDAHEMKSALRVGAQLKSDGVALAAIDFISGKICDYNITSPGLLIQLEKVHGKNFAKEIVETLINPLLRTI